MNKNRYKLLLVDIDGTMLNRNGTISAEDRDAITRAIGAGIQVSLSTGRVMVASLGIIHQLSLDGCHIFFDGALVSDPADGAEVYVEPISQESLRQMIEFAHQQEINLELQSTASHFIERETWASDIRRRFFGLESTIVDFNGVWAKERIIKGAMTVRSAEDRAKADVFYRHFAGSLSFSWTKTPAYPEIDFINVLAPQVSKGKALEKLVSHLGISSAEVMAIGDGPNDISLLSKAGLAIAMGNALAEVKAVADYVTLDVELSGVAAALEKFLL
ncbi:Cof-type HAD-IIB family hydrolase [Chloroflexota bacterium]